MFLGTSDNVSQENSLCTFVWNQLMFRAYDILSLTTLFLPEHTNQTVSVREGGGGNNKSWKAQGYFRLILKIYDHLAWICRLVRLCHILMSSDAHNLDDLIVLAAILDIRQYFNSWEIEGGWMLNHLFFFFPKIAAKMFLIFHQENSITIWVKW